MFQKVQKPLEECIEDLRVLANSSGKNHSILLTDLRIRENIEDIRKVVGLCELLVYYYDKIDEI